MPTYIHHEAGVGVRNSPATTFWRSLAFLSCRPLRAFEEYAPAARRAARSSRVTLGDLAGLPLLIVSRSDRRSVRGRAGLRAASEGPRRRNGAATETGRRTGGEAANKPLGIDRAFPWLTARASTPKADY